MNLEPQIAKEQKDLRRHVRMMRLCDAIRDTVQVWPETPDTRVDDVHVVLTNRTSEVLAPFVSAVEILRDIIYASDGCMGHRLCEHSMEPWTQARALIMRLDDEEYRNDAAAFYLPRLPRP